jgi:hypothetical protein
MQVVRNSSDDIHKEFGFEKCEKAVLKRGKLAQSPNLMLDSNRDIQELEQGKACMYLRTEEIEGIQLQQMKE